MVIMMLYDKVWHLPSSQKIKNEMQLEPSEQVGNLGKLLSFIDMSRRERQGLK